MQFPCGGWGKGAKSNVISVLFNSLEGEVSEIMIGDANVGFVAHECAGASYPISAARLGRSLRMVVMPVSHATGFRVSAARPNSVVGCVFIEACARLPCLRHLGPWRDRS